MNYHKETRVHCCVCETCQRHPYSAIAKQHRAINRVLAGLNEKSRRRFVGLLALQWGRGSIQLLRRITGLSRTTIRRGRAEAQCLDRETPSRIRRSGGGRQAVEKKSLEF